MMCDVICDVYDSDPTGNALLTYTVSKLTQAETLYKQMNP